MRNNNKLGGGTVFSTEAGNPPYEIYIEILKKSYQEEMSSAVTI